MNYHRERFRKLTFGALALRLSEDTHPTIIRYTRISPYHLSPPDTHLYLSAQKTLTLSPHHTRISLFLLTAQVHRTLTLPSQHTACVSALVYGSKSFAKKDQLFADVVALAALPITSYLLVAPTEIVIHYFSLVGHSL